MGRGFQANPLNLLWIRHCSVFLPSGAVGRSVTVACPGHTHFLFDTPQDNKFLKRSPDTESREVYLLNTRVNYEALTGVLWNREKWHLYQENGGTKAKIMSGTKIILEIREHFQFLGNMEQVGLRQGNKGTGTPPGRASTVSR